MLLVLPKEQCVLSPQLSIAPAVARRVPVILKVKPGGIQLRLARPAELLVFRAQQSHVRIIIPGNETAVAHRPKQGTGYDVVVNVAFSAYPVNFLQKFQLGQLEPAKLFVRQMNHCVFLPCAWRYNSYNIMFYLIRSYNTSLFYLNWQEASIVLLLPNRPV